MAYKDTNKYMYRFGSTLLLLLFTTMGFSQSDALNWGLKFRIGGRYDNMRMCVASPAGAKGGMAADISLIKEFRLNDKTRVHIDIPAMRPILFAAAFKMLQFEPSVNLRYSKTLKNNKKFIYGPGLGLSLHYGPDYHAEETLPNGKNSYFAMGPIINSYFGINLPTKKGSVISLGINPYATPLFSINDSQNRNGIIIGGFLDTSIWF